MKIGNYITRLVSISVSLFVSIDTISFGEDNPVIVRWNGDVQCQTLNRSRLNEVKVLPTWKIKQMTWPVESDIASHIVVAGPEAKSSCMKWLERFVEKEYLSDEIEGHLIALKNWGLIREEAQQKRLCDVFIVRLKKGPLVVQMQESPFNVVLSVADERLNAKRNPNHKELAIDIAKHVLREELNPDPKSDLQAFSSSSNGITVTKIIWLTKSVGTADPNGKKCANLSQAEKNGAIEVETETDGTFVRFDIVKYSGGPAAYLDPYVARFGLSQ